MLVSTKRLFARIQAAYEQPDKDGLHAAAESCMSYLVLYLRRTHLALPEALVPLYNKLPEAKP